MEAGKKLRSPSVGAGCDELCIFKDGVEGSNTRNSWCFKGAPPAVRIGWTFEQKFKTTTAVTLGGVKTDATKYYQVKLLPYTEVQAYIDSSLNIERLIYWELIADLKKFKLSNFNNLMVNSDFAVCGGLGYEIDRVDFDVTMSFKFMQCYKHILKDLCDFSSTWTGYGAKILDNCTQSSDAQIGVSKFKLIDEAREWVFFGTASPTSKAYCYPLPGVGKNAVAVSAAGVKDGF